MERVLLNISLLLLLIYFYRIARHGLHIVQLSNYYLDKYWAWTKRYKTTVLNIKTIVIILIGIALFVLSMWKSNIDILMYLAYGYEIFAFIFLIFSIKKKKEKKPFVVTARIRRVYCTYLIFFIIGAVLTNIFSYRVGICIFSFCAIFAYYFVYIISTINKPIEKMVRGKFIRQAKHKLKEMNGMDVIGITGSYGKTSTKYIINTILSQKYNTLMTPASYNTTMGVVRTINEKLSAIHQLFICEMGAMYVGDIKEITDIVNPKYGVLTAIGPQHLDSFKTIENVKKTKLELIDSLPQDGIAFVNWEDENIRNSKILKKIVKYGLSDSADYYATNINVGEKGSTFDVVTPKGDKISIKTKLLGKLNILNIVGGVAVADTLGLTNDQIKMGIKYLKPVAHRLQMKNNPNGSITIDDAYNSNIQGASMALEVLKSFTTKKRILITPGIVELGEKQNEINKELGTKAADSADYIILVGANQAIPIFAGIREAGYPEGNVYIAENLQDALNKMNEIITKDSVVLLENDLPDNYL